MLVALLNWTLMSLYILKHLCHDWFCLYYQNCRMSPTSLLLFSDCLIPFCTLENLQKLQSGHKQHICRTSWYGVDPFIYAVKKSVPTCAFPIFFPINFHFSGLNALHLHASSFPIHCPHRLHTCRYQCCGIYDANDVGDTGVLPIMEDKTKHPQKITNAFQLSKESCWTRKVASVATLNGIQPFGGSSEFWNVLWKWFGTLIKSPHMKRHTGKHSGTIMHHHSFDMIAKNSLSYILHGTHMYPIQCARCQHLGLLVSHLPEFLRLSGQTEVQRSRRQVFKIGLTQCMTVWLRSTTSASQ